MMSVNPIGSIKVDGKSREGGLGLPISSPSFGNGELARKTIGGSTSSSAALGGSGGVGAAEGCLEKRPKVLVLPPS